MRRHPLLISLLISISSALFFIPFLGAVHLFDWDEINFAESAREMIASGNYMQVQINYAPFWEKPPLFFWMQSLSMHLFGINEFAARFPNALTGIITMLTFYFIGRRHYNARLGLLWVLCMMGSFLPHLYFKSGIIDPVFNYFIFLGIYCWARMIAEKKPSKAIAFALCSGVLIGLGTLTKGPVALLIILLCTTVYWFMVRFRSFMSLKQLSGFSIMFLLIAGIWFAIDIRENGLGFVGQFINYQVELLTQPVAGHDGPVYYHFLVVFTGCFPMSVIALPALINKPQKNDAINLHLWMSLLFWVVIILFSLVRTKIVHYSSLTYFPLSFLAATVLEKNWGNDSSLPRWMLWCLSVFGTIFSFLLFAAPFAFQHPQWLLPYLNDPFAVDCLNSKVAWTGFESLIGIGYWLSIIAAIYLLWKGNTKIGSSLLFSATALCMLIYLKAVVPKIEAYSQGPAIRFYENLSGKNVYIVPIGFKSYAQYYYFQKPPGDSAQSSEEEWLLHDAIDRPAYFVLKTTSMNRMKQYADIKLLYKEGGFAFYIREPHR